jgi:hypothetical protein
VEEGDFRSLQLVPQRRFVAPLFLCQPKDTLLPKGRNKLRTLLFLKERVWTRTPKQGRTGHDGLEDVSQRRGNPWPVESLAWRLPKEHKVTLVEVVKRVRREDASSTTMDVHLLRQAQELPDV